MSSFRASCQFCRKRKIKCSGETGGCKACEARNQECVYESSSQMGRPRKPAPGSPSSVKSTPSSVSKSPGSKLKERRLREAEAAAEEDAKDGSDPEFTPVSSFRSPSISAEVRPKRARIERQQKPDAASFELATGMDRLRVTKDIRSTFAQFSSDTIGSLVQSFFGIITSDERSTSPASATSSSNTPVDSPTSPTAPFQKLLPIIPNAPAPSASARFYYESAIRGIKSSLVPNEGVASRRARIAETYMLWERWGPEIIKWSTIGVPSGRGNGNGLEGEEPLLVRLFQMDESLPITYSIRTTRRANPIENLETDELMHLLTQFFILSPYAFIINDAILLESIQDGTYDPVVVSLMVIYVLTRDPSIVDPPLSPPNKNTTPLSAVNDAKFPSFKSPSAATRGPMESVSPTSGNSPSVYIIPPSSLPTVDPSLLMQSRAPPATSTERAAFLESSTRAAVEPYLTFVEETLFNRMSESGATSISTIQSLLLLATHYFHTLNCRRAWALVCTGLVCVRENLGRRRSERAHRDEERRMKGGAATGERIRNDKELVEDEQSVNLWWLLAIFGSWSFLALDLPRSTMIDVTDSLPLPPFAFSSSPSYVYRHNHPNFSTVGVAVSSAIATAIDDGIDRCLKSFNETCRTLSLIVALSTREAAVASSEMEQAYQASPNYSAPEPKAAGGQSNPATDPRASSTGVWSLFIAQWLVQISDQHAGSPASSSGTATTQGSRSVPKNAFLSTIHAIMALHRLTSFDSPAMTAAASISVSNTTSSINLDAEGLRLAIRSMQLVVRGVREKVRDALKRGGGKNDGEIKEQLAMNGLLKLVGDCLPHCFKILDYLADASTRDSEIYTLVCEKQSAIAQLSEDLNALRDCGLGSPITETRSSPNEFEGFGLLPTRARSLGPSIGGGGSSRSSYESTGSTIGRFGEMSQGEAERNRGPSITSSTSSIQSAASSPLFPNDRSCSISTAASSTTPRESKDGWSPYNHQSPQSQSLQLRLQQQQQHQQQQQQPFHQHHGQFQPHSQHHHRQASQPNESSAAYSYLHQQPKVHLNRMAGSDEVMGIGIDSGAPSVSGAMMIGIESIRKRVDGNNFEGGNLKEVMGLAINSRSLPNAASIFSNSPPGLSGHTGSTLGERTALSTLSTSAGKISLRQASTDQFVVYPSHSSVSSRQNSSVAHDETLPFGYPPPTTTPPLVNAMRSLNGGKADGYVEEYATTSHLTTAYAFPAKKDHSPAKNSLSSAPITNRSGGYRVPLGINTSNAGSAETSPTSPRTLLVNAPILAQQHPNHSTSTTTANEYYDSRHRRQHQLSISSIDLDSTLSPTQHQQRHQEFQLSPIYPYQPQPQNRSSVTPTSAYAEPDHPPPFFFTRGLVRDVGTTAAALPASSRQFISFPPHLPMPSAPHAHANDS